MEREPRWSFEYEWWKEVVLFYMLAKIEAQFRKKHVMQKVHVNLRRPAVRHMRSVNRNR